MPLIELEDWQSLNQFDRLLVGFSGGLDSTVLLHLLSQRFADRVVALHFNHGLQADSQAWQAACQSVCDGLGITFVAGSGQLDSSAPGIEARAREARFRFFQQQARPGDCILLAHHADDQAETILLRLMRGSGVRGLAGIPANRDLPNGVPVMRPLLEYRRSELEQYASRYRLSWTEDPSNQDATMDRNFLRHQILPRLQERWPDAVERLTRSAKNLTDALQLQSEYVQRLKVDCEVAPVWLGFRWSTAKWQTLSGASKRAVLEQLCRESGYFGATASVVETLEREIVEARDDADPLVNVGGLILRRYRENLYLLRQSTVQWAETSWDGVDRLDLGEGVYLSGGWYEGSWRLRHRRQGEKIIGPDGSRRLKQLFKESAVPVWVRNWLPVIENPQGELVAVAGLRHREPAKCPPDLMATSAGGEPLPLW